jgi:hypothetical protein
MNRFLIGFVVLLSTISSHGLLAEDKEDDNDTLFGGEGILAPATVTNYTITAGDADWFLVKKGRCNLLTVTMTPAGGNNDIFSLELYDVQETSPVLITAKSGMGNSPIELSTSLRLENIDVRVYGEDVTNSPSYDLSFGVANLNTPIENEIDKLKKRLVKMLRRLQPLEKRDTKPRQIRELKRKTNNLEVEIKKLDAKLCA